jgi:tetratricopeptide (TPR) repeat protein
MRDALASRCMERGIALLNENSVASLGKALRYFEVAIRLRRRLPLQEGAWSRYLLAGSWINRAHALDRFAPERNFAEALHSYDQALQLLGTLETETNSLYSKRLALAWSNRGVILQQAGRLHEALESFDHAIALRETATALTNRGTVLLALDAGDAARARADAQKALHLLSGAETRDFSAAETGLKARHVLCRALALQLEGASDPGLIARATDAAEDALVLIRYWEEDGETRFRDLAREFFRFGARAYQLHQPQFLREFVCETASAFSEDEEMQRVAMASLAMFN